jgi:ribosomal protein S6--L-glutamate ligase
MEIGILVFSLPRDDFASGHERLRSSVEALGHVAHVFYEPLLGFIQYENEIKISYDGKPLPQLDVLITRPGYIEEPGLHGHVVDLLKRAGYLVINSSEGTSFSKNKIAQHVVFSGVGIPMPRWGVAHSTTEAVHVAKSIGFPVVIKVPFGTWGAGVFFAPQLEVLHTIAHYLSVRDRNPMLIEEFIKEAENSDIRVFVVGGKVIAAMQRTARANDIRANTSIGGSGKFVELGSDEIELAIRVVQIAGLEIAGVDIIRSARGPLILEINANPGFKEIEKVTGIDIAGAIISYALTRISLTKM